jgi:Tol biopolymer transport system component/C-terminal processing protease CtpA/Prc
MKLFLVNVFLLLTGISFASEDWMRYSSISPDGKSIAFSYQGDLFTVDVNGGEAKQITSHTAYDYLPVWSNDSKSIAFASNRFGNFDVFLVDKDGGVPSRLTFHSSNDYPYDFTPSNDKIVFLSNRLDQSSSVQFPYPLLGEVYEVAVSGGREIQSLSISAEDINFSKDGNFMLFHDRKGYEDEWRKHQVSSVARDIILYDLKKKTFKQLTNWDGEDRNPIFIDNNTYYFLSEKSGSFNIWKGSINGNAYSEQITDFKTHPIRFLSMSENGTLCFGYHGEIYTLVNGQAKKVEISIRKDDAKNDIMVLPIGGKASEFAVSPDGTEIVFVSRGNVFVSSVEFGTTKRITDTPEQERNVSFSPDGKKILYAGERNNSWNIYEVAKVNETEKYFYNSTLIKETALIVTSDEDFDPKYSPDGEEVAFLRDRTTLCVYNLKSKETRTVLAGSYNYSYSDGDQYYTWAPDSKYLLVQFFEFGRWNSDIGLVAASGKEKPLNLTQSGYGSSNPKFSMDGQMVYYATDKYGMRSHGSWGSQVDVEGVFLTKDAFYKFTLNEEEYKAWKAEEEEAKKKEEEAKKTDSDTKKEKTKKDDKTVKEEVKQIKIEMEGLYDRKVRLTIHSSNVADFILNKEATEMYYLSNFEKGYDLWTTKFKSNETKILSKLGSGGSNLILDKEQKFIYFNNNGTVNKFELAASTAKPIMAGGEMNLNAPAEREYMFEHAWRQAKEKFYVEDLHGVDWEFYKKEYQPKLGSINNGFDFSELLSELLGELNASHTGARFYAREDGGDQTAALGCYFDETFSGDGVKIVEIMDKSPLTLHSSKIKKGCIIEKIDGEAILKGQNYYPLLNRKIGKKVLLSMYDPSTKQRWDEIITPISNGHQDYLAYERWVKRCEFLVDSLSNGRVGYVHVEGMDSESFRKMYDKALGKLNQKEALIVDTRFNGGGWLHDDLATFLSGKLYMEFEPRGQKNMGGEPISKWQKPSCVLMSEGNYSDAHLFPYTYKALNIGPLIGMPVPGTGTAVWWEMMIDGATVFGIPQIGMRSVSEGYLVENHELQPDIKVKNEYEMFTKGVDQQLVKAVEEMLRKK